jgi:hypothetical protein
VGGVVRLAGRDAVGGGERAEFVDVRAVCANAGTDDGGVKRSRGAHEIENVRASVLVRVGQEYRMQALVERLAKELLVERNGVEAEEYGGRPRRENAGDLTDHVVVCLPRRVRRVRERCSREMQRFRRRYDLRH